MKNSRKIRNTLQLIDNSLFKWMQPIRSLKNWWYMLVASHVYTANRSLDKWKSTIENFHLSSIRFDRSKNKCQWNYPKIVSLYPLASSNISNISILTLALSNLILESPGFHQHYSHMHKDILTYNKHS